VIADDGMDAATRADMQQWTGCMTGALTEAEFRAALRDSGLVDIEIRPTHRVHPHAGSAIIRARKPATSACAVSRPLGVPILVECRLDLDGERHQRDR
jgi:hypothetical protein